MAKKNNGLSKMPPKSERKISKYVESHTVLVKDHNGEIGRAHV